ncbi:MAG: DUF4878 domain-containing protein [Lentisphaerae bacterium]|nr:DUF4878 domain-containing protein [Lentisphaerota bacterium]
MLTKKIFAMFTFAAAMLFTVTLRAQGKEISAPEKALKTFFTSMANADFAAAKKCVEAKELISMLSLLEQLAKENPETKADAAAEFAPMLKAETKLVEIKGDIAKIEATVISRKNKKSTETFTLKKIGGIWKIVD